MPTPHHRRQQAIRTYSCPPGIGGVPHIILPDVHEEDGGAGYYDSISHKMPYAEPTSPIPSPAKETSSRKGWMSPPTHIEDMDAGPSMATGPMPGIPRRTSSNHSSSSSTPRRNMSPTVSRHPSTSQSFVASRPMEGLPRRSSGGSGLSGVAGLPADGGSLGLKLHPSPVKSTVPPPTRPPLQDPSSSTSTVDSSLPTTPSDEPQDLPYESPKDRYLTSGIPFPPYVPPPRNAAPTRSAMSPARPTLMNSRRVSQINTHSHRREGHSGSLQMFPQSSSTSHLPAQSMPVGAHSPIPRPASMIRKKSGEVVKPSLKQRSMSTPDLTRQQNDSAPSTPGEDDRDFPEERSKSVRFADANEDADGLALENVVLFLREQKVTAIGKAADPDRAGVITDTETERDEDQMSDFVQFRTRRNAAAQKTDDDRLVMEGGARVPRVRVDFSPESREALRRETVVMERIELATDAGPLHLKGTAIVKNLSFQKWVAVRFTLDHWQTVSEVAGLHVTHIPSDTTGDEGWDRFSFSIKLEDYKRKLDERQLVMCIRYSIDGQEWWDSNDGLNYNFTFKKAAPRRVTRHSGPAQYKVQNPSIPTIPGLRQNRVISPSSQINRAFGVTETNRVPTAGPKSWIFPKFAAHIEGPTRPESPPITAAPPASFMAPKIPDIHTHLSLSKYCAPSPPQSPPREDYLSAGGGANAGPYVLSPDTDPNMSGFVNGHPATLYPARVVSVHERRSSWNGESGSSWSSFSQALAETESESSQGVDGETTPIALRSRSPQGSKDSRDPSPEYSGLRTKRSTGDLRALLSDETPPSSNISSPPSPAIIGLPMMPMSPSNSSTASTGRSSPATVSRDSGTSLSELVIQVDPEERGRVGEPKMLTNSYQEFLDRFCFFQSPRLTPVEGVVKSNNMRLPTFANSGQTSPNGFPFFASSSGNSPRGTPTPTGQYDSASDAFNFAPHHLRKASTATTESSSSEPGDGEDEGSISTISTIGAEDENDTSSSTLSGVSYNSNTTPKATPLLGNSPPMANSQLGEMAAGYGSEGLPWARLAHQPPASLAAGH